MIGSLYAGVSGLKANTDAMSVIGDNIANVNTTGFKGSDSSFANVLNQSMGGGSGNQIGSGVTMTGVRPDWTQGTTETTGNATDLAIRGSGFFIVSDENGASYYTRAGEFDFDKDDNLVNPDGLFVQGYDSSGAFGPITISEENTSQPQETSGFAVGLNLDAEAALGDTYSNTLTIYDSLGNDIPLTIEFTKQATPAAGGSEWDWSALVPASVSTAVPVATGTIVFDVDGNLTSPAANPTIDVTGTGAPAVPLLNGADVLSITWTFLDSSNVSDGSITGYASASSITSKSQNGYAAGILQGTSVDETGNLIGTYSNGQIETLYQIALADFSDYSGLTKMGGNLYAESLTSGQPLINTAGSGKLGTIAPTSLEMSNVDLATEFTKMITTQRAFQANSRVITTSDEILTELMSIKR
jgi:flagellar hook protein FlgE